MSSLKMSFAGDKLYNDYIRKNMGTFNSTVKVTEIMPHLPCLTQSDRDEIGAKREQAGNYNAMQLLVDCLKRRENWSEELISALRACEHYALAQVVQDKYNSFLVNPKSPSPATTVVKAHVHPAPTPNPSLPIPESSDDSASASPAQPAPLAEPAPQPSPPLRVAVDPPPAPQPSPPLMAAVDPPPAPQPSPPLMAAVDPPPAPQPSPPLMAAVDPPPAPQPSPPLIAAVDPPPAPLPSPPLRVDPAPLPSPPLRVDPVPLPSTPLRAVDPHLEVAPASPESPQQQAQSSVAPSDPKPPPPATPVTIEIPPQRAPSPPVAVLQEVPTDDTLTSRDDSALASQVAGFDLGLTSEAVRPTDTPASSQADQIPTAPVEASQSQRTPPGQTDSSSTTEPSPSLAISSLDQMKLPVQDTAPLSPVVLFPAQQPVEDSDPTIQVTSDYEQAEAPQPLSQPVSEPTVAPCWSPVDGADGPVSTLSDEYFSKPAPLLSTPRYPDSPATNNSIPEASNSLNIGCLEISGLVPGLDPESAARAPTVCSTVTSDPEVAANPGPCQQNGVLEEDTSVFHNEPEENHFESNCQSSLGDQEVLTNLVHVYEEPSVLNHEGQTQSMMGNAVSSFEDPPVKNNDSQSQIILGDGVPESDDLHESVQSNAACIADDSKSQILNGQATKELISDPPVSDVTISVIAASSSEDSQNSELEEDLLKQETQWQEPQEGGTIPLKNPTNPKNQKNYYLLTAAAVGVSALFVAWRLRN
ncbi:mitochondrial antiviral-signaling protein isoform X1 [Osmerus mordax]|uniref:mitochondrial antiviral-signaling protein isoform X1 n=2 Tax=Osmerus mordax TaxID=8014 RepID=UPI0035107184